jgi:hypothetical protein
VLIKNKTEKAFRTEILLIILAATIMGKDSNIKFYQATHIVGQLYGVPHGMLRVFNTILYENEFQNPQIFQQTISLFPEHSTLFLSFIGVPTLLLFK